jgi:hypothetical protein
MWRALLDSGVELIKEMASRLRGADRRRFQAEVAKDACGGSPRKAESMFGWGREAVCKGLAELEFSFEVVSNFDQRGRRLVDLQIPGLAEAVIRLVDNDHATQADPKFQTTFSFTRVTGTALRQSLASLPEMAEVSLPCPRTLHGSSGDCQRS